MAALHFDNRALDDLTIEDEASFRHVGLYTDLKAILRRDRYEFRVLPEAMAGRWDRALCLNLTFWSPESGGDILVDASVPADVVAHVAWHHLATRALGVAGQRPSAEALLLGESIASAFDVYLVGRLLGHAPSSTFLETQVPAMADAAADAGVEEGDFEGLLRDVSAEPETAFEELRALLFDVSCALVGCNDATDALAVFEGVSAHPFAPLLHRFELSNWVLYARAYASHALGPDPVVRAVDEALRGPEGGLDWLSRTWVRG